MMNDATAHLLLEERRILRVSGPDRREFLQGLITNDLTGLTPGTAVYAALLTPQGKYLFDFLIYEDGDDILLDCERERIDDLVRRLSLYRLRAAVDIEDSGELHVYALPFADETIVAGLRNACPEALIAPDPRHPALGWRALLGPQEEAMLAPHLTTPLSRNSYEDLRIRHAVPDGSRDLLIEKTYILEAGFERLHGVSFEKGCYIGQELTARMKYRATIRRCLRPVAFDSAPPPSPGTDILHDGKPVGQIRSGTGNLALAFLRCDVLDNEQTRPILTADGRNCDPLPLID